MAQPISLAFLTCHEVAPDEAVRIAAETGYDLVGLRFLPAAPTEPPYPVLTDPAAQARLAAALADTGIGLADIEIARLGPATDLEAYRPLLALGERFGARHVLVAGDDPDPARLTETFARFCDLAARHGLTADLEFMPWTGVKSLPEAQRIVAAAGAANGGVLVDALHWDRSHGTTAEIAALPGRLVHYAQLCDGPADYDPGDEGLIRIARDARLLPGAGGIDLVGMVAALPADTVLSLEVPRRAEAATLDARTRAAEALAAARAVIARAEQARRTAETGAGG